MSDKTPRNTKQRILDVGLKLFSNKGYDGVGVRDIAKELGIRESALYKHYRGKQDIFDNIVKQIEERYEMENVNGESTYAAFEDMDNTRKEVFNLCITMFRFYLTNDYGIQLRRMLTIEQYRNTTAGTMFRDLIINRGLEYITEKFQSLIKQGIYQDEAADIMAMQFYAPLYLLLSKYDGLVDEYEKAIEQIEKHLLQFDNVYKVVKKQ